MMDYYKKNIGEILENFHTSEHGLTGEEAKKRLIDYGPNKLPDGQVDSYFIIFFRQFQSPLIYILLTACIILFLMGEIADSIIILIVLIFNSIVGSVQEGKAQNTLQALKKFTETKATVLRDNVDLIIPDAEVVPGDILILQEGEKIPADARIIYSSNLRTDESALTGESEPVQKIADKIEADNLLIADQKNMLFKGTNILVGNGKAVVIATGLKTVIGKISKEISGIDTAMPLKKNIHDLSNLIIYVVSVLSILLFCIGVLSGQTAVQMFGVVISLAVSIIPEGLPIVITLVLATGVWRMSKRNALIKKLQAVEALGQAKIIAVDKTGTLTRNEMVVEQAYLPDLKDIENNFIFNIAGNGYEPKGEIHLAEKVIDLLCRNHQYFLSG